MTHSLEQVPPMVYASQIHVPYTWWAGDTTGRFLKALRDEHRIVGNRCDRCHRVFVPPRKTCPTCFTANASWVDVAAEGRVVAFTVARRQLEALRRKAPVIFALVLLDGADTALLHIIDQTDPAGVFIGMRVRACFADTAEATIAAISHFAPIDQENPPGGRCHG